ncbi:MAG TPA: glutamate dehydrogenase, partial [Anaerolineae bacterium]|nr:glutamate dehydrogenase [Anaerolineae bacterium]
WMMDEYSRLVGQYTPGVFTGKPVGGGGSLGRTEATGYGVIYTVREAMKHINLDPKNSVAALQGFGNVSQYAAIGFVEILGGTVACVSCYDRHDKKAYTYSKKGGIDPRFLISIVDQYGTIDKQKALDSGYEVTDGDKWLEADVNVLIPAALEGQITKETVKKVSKNLKLVAEGANGPTTPEADEAFKKNNVFVIPDFLCNAGGVTVSYFEQVQNDANYYWEKDAVLRRLDVKMTAAFNAVLNRSIEEKVYTRDAAYMVAIDRVVTAMEMRGWLTGNA